MDLNANADVESDNWNPALIVYRSTGSAPLVRNGIRKVTRLTFSPVEGSEFPWTKLTR